MPTPANQLDQLLATTFDSVRSVLADQITHKVTLLAALNQKSRVTVDGGVEIRRPLMFALNNTVGTYDGYDILDTTPQGGFGYAVFPWKQYAGTITISGKELRQNSGVPQIIGLLQAKIQQLELSFEDDLNAMLFGNGTGNGGKDFLGLEAIIDNTGTLGGIDSAVETWWQSKVVVGPVDLTVLAGVKSLNNMYNSLVVSARSKVDYELTTQANFEAYENLAAPQIRFVDTRMAELGFEAIAHKTAEVVLDVDTPGAVGGGRWYFINSDNLEFVQHPAAWMNRRPFVEPYNQDARTAKVISMGNLITDNRRALGVIKDTTV